MQVSIVIPAYNRVDTLEEAVESLIAQTHPDWEAVIVDDGSVDGTLELAHAISARDSRIRVAKQAHEGVCEARNHGIRLARFDRLLFLDADDWLAPAAFERFASVLGSAPGLDAVHCRWARVAVDGTQLLPAEWLESEDMFPVLGSYQAFPIHACVIRRSVVEAVGGFDRSFTTCEEWDFWQRIARTGARFGHCRELLAFYRMRPGSSASNAAQVFHDTLRVLHLTHGPDPRVKHSHPAYGNGLPEDRRVAWEYMHLCWCAGTLIGTGNDPLPLVKALEDRSHPLLAPGEVAGNILLGGAIAMGRDPSAWGEMWRDRRDGVDRLLAALEHRSKTPGLARRTQAFLEGLILEHARQPLPLTIGRTHMRRVEVADTIADIELEAEVERLRCVVELEGAPLGVLDLPVFDHRVTGYVLADALANAFAWKILDRFFQKTVYASLDLRREGGAVAAWRSGVCLVSGLSEDPEERLGQLHEQAGWTVFLQEVWGRPGMTTEQLYDPATTEEPAVLHRSGDEPLPLEVSEELPDLALSGDAADVLLSVGGVPLGRVTVSAADGRVGAGALRATLTRESGYELCRAAVREGLVGRPLSDPAPLRARLAAAAARRRETAHADAPVRPADVMGGAAVFSLARSSEEPMVLVPRYSPGLIDTSISRRAALPLAALEEITRLVEGRGSSMVHTGDRSSPAREVAYAPDLLMGTPKLGLQSGRPRDPESCGAAGKETGMSRAYFEELFASGSDPWKYTTAYEQTKYEQTLSLLPRGRIGRALELACAEGHFTVQLAPRVRHLIASDISLVALERARDRCRAHGNIEFLRLDLTRETLPGPMDLIVCSEVLYFVGGRDELTAVAWEIAEALAPGGCLVMAHAHCVVDEPDLPGFNWDVPFGAKTIGETFAAIPSLQLARELRTPLYRIQLFRRRSRRSGLFPRRATKIIEFDRQPTALTPEVEAMVLWHGGRPVISRGGAPAVTRNLPILTYHRIASHSPEGMRRYCVDPRDFEKQLGYLRDAGYYSVTLEEWRRAMAAHQPLPGRAVLFTFDDGYLDFFRNAWPLLHRYGFGATVFLVAGEIGRTNCWDREIGEELPLMGWDHIGRLQGEGIEFGSHGYHHRMMTALTPTEMVREAVRSRALLEEHLGAIVTAFAYPHGAEDPVVRHVVGASGYIFGLSCRAGASGEWDDLLVLPRVEITGTDRLQDFIRKLDV